MEFKIGYLKILSELTEEVNAATEKHPVWPKDNVHRAAIVAEEAGEVVREANHLLEGHGSIDLLRMELIQTGATVIRMLDQLDNDAFILSKE